LGVSSGDQVLLSGSDEAHELLIATRQQGLQHARDLVKHYAIAADFVVDAFISERKQAAADE